MQIAPEPAQGGTETAPGAAPQAQPEQGAAQGQPKTE
jgi:hypothetical protein